MTQKTFQSHDHSRGGQETQSRKVRPPEGSTLLKVTEADASPGPLTPATLLEDATHRRGQRRLRSQVTWDILAGLPG